jgi:hypothetical protein
MLLQIFKLAVIAMTTLKLDNGKTVMDFVPVRYDIYIFGGRYVEMSPSFKIKITNKASNESVPTYEYGLKQRISDGIRYFYCDIPNAGEYDISFKYYDDIVVKKSMLRIVRLFQSKLDVGQIRIGIERK